MTSTAGWRNGKSFGWINYKLIENPEKKILSSIHMEEKNGCGLVLKVVLFQFISGKAMSRFLLTGRCQRKWIPNLLR
jgi:hypothetical protein